MVFVDGHSTWRSRMTKQLLHDSKRKASDSRLSKEVSWKNLDDGYAEKQDMEENERKLVSQWGWDSESSTAIRRPSKGWA